MSEFLTQQDFERIFTSHIKIETYSKSIESLFSPRSLSKIVYDPYYQRNYVWDDHKASYFIESILLGTEIPPLIFFNNGSSIEVIDGRQRFETIKRFNNNEFLLTRDGLAALKQFSKSTYTSLQTNKETKEIIDLFLDAKIRIIEFEIVNEPRLDSNLEDKVKKEIFGRYNSGITPLTKSQIDNAYYDRNSIFQSFKEFLKQDPEFCRIITDTFLPKRGNSKNFSNGNILQFIRKYLVLHQFPIKYYSGGSRTEVLDKLYERLEESLKDDNDVNELRERFSRKIYLIHEMSQVFVEQKLFVNRLGYECLLWILNVLETEGIDLDAVRDNSLIERLGQDLSSNQDKFVDSQYRNHVNERFSFIAQFFENEFVVNLAAYVAGDKKSRDELNRVRNNESDTESKLSELESLRVTKPDPSRNSIDDIARMMNRNMFLVRPSYQRDEVISISKASSIIESILLGISLPPIFIYKRKDGVSEVIDGQQRLLTILGFIGQKYIDENGQQCFTKNNGFSLKGIKILESLNNKNYSDFKDIDPSLQDKILDFELLVVEIQENLNPDFNPVDLFVRLNNKPYPIQENSFEMWNSWVDRELIENIRNNVKDHKKWFYIKLLRDHKDRDRMENEELYTSFVYLEYQRMTSKGKDVATKKSLDIYNKNDGVGVRIASSYEITKLLQSAFEDANVKSNLQKSIKSVESFIRKVRTVLLDRDVEGEQNLVSFLEGELNSLFRADRQLRSFRRTKYDFYILWYLLSPLNFEMVRFKRLDIKRELKEIFSHSRTNREVFLEKSNDLHAKYIIDQRQTKLSKVELAEKLKAQDNRCPISGAPLFIGDDIEVDHEVPISKGGSDSEENLQVTHKDENRKKGSKFLLGDSTVIS